MKLAPSVEISLELDENDDEATSIDLNAHIEEVLRRGRSSDMSDLPSVQLSPDYLAELEHAYAQSAEGGTSRMGSPRPFPGKLRR